jgi:hypothetical protein
LIFWQKRAKRISNIEKNQATILDEIESIIVPYYTQNWRDYANSRSSYMIIGRICIKIKPNAIIRF